MASELRALPPAAAPASSSTAIRSFADRQARPYPGWWRLVLFAGVFAPFAVLMLVVGERSDAHLRLIERVQAGAGASPYPPIPALVASIWPEDVWLVAVAAAAAGWTLRMIARGFVDREMGRPLRWLLLAACISSPGLQRVVAGDLEAALSLSLGLIALSALVGFADDGVTADGFFAGIALGAAVLVDPAAIWLCLLCGCWAMGRAWLRERRRVRPLQAAIAAGTVVMFPAAASLLAVVVLSWSSGVGVGAELVESASTHEAAALSTVGLAMLRNPLFLVGIGLTALRAHREPTALVVHLIPLALLAVAAVSTTAPSPEFAAALLLGAALLVLRPHGPVRTVDLMFLAVLQVALNATWAAGYV